MAVRLRLMRTGRSGQPFYRIVAVDGRKRRDGAYLEKIGHYNPRTAPPELVIDDAKAFKWLKQGASPSDTVRSLFSRKGLLLGWNLQKKGVSQEEIELKVAEFRRITEANLLEKAKVATAAAATKKVKATVAPAAAAESAPPSAEPETAPPAAEPETDSSGPLSSEAEGAA